MSQIAAHVTGLWPDPARLRRWYRAAHAIPTKRVALAAVLVPAGPVLVLAAGGEFGTVQGVLLALYLGIAASTDLLWRRIPNWLTVAALGWVAGLHLLAPAGAGWVGLPSAADSVLGAFACLGVMLLMHLMFRGGEGDVKLLLAVGALVGPWHGIEALAFGYFAAAPVALTLLIGSRLGAKHPPFQARSLPMAPFFAIGVFLTLNLPPV